MNRGSESRFLQLFLAVAASLVIVGGGLILLTSTAPWTPRQEPESKAAMSTAAHDRAGTEVATDIAFAPAGSAPDQALTGGAEAGTGAHSGEETQAAEAGSEEVQAEETQAPSGEETQEAEAQPGAPEPVQTVPSDAPSLQEDDAIAASDVPQSGETGAVEAEAIAAESMIVSDAGQVPESAVEIGAVPEPAGVVASEPAAPVAAEASPAATDQIGDLLAPSRPEAVATETVSEDTGEAADIRAADAPGETMPDASPAARPEVAAAVPLPPPPLPKRKPKAEPPAPAETARSAPRPERPSRPDKPEQPRQAVAQQTPAQPRTGVGRWLPMALAPADKPVPQPTPRLSGAAYSSKVWAALARHKPRAGQSGSATVVFTIGAGGRLGGVRIGQSSGNPKIDQLALATVRGAAPFPPPPSGPASFSIRIDFH